MTKKTGSTELIGLPISDAIENSQEVDGHSSQAPSSSASRRAQPLLCSFSLGVVGDSGQEKSYLVGGQLYDGMVKYVGPLNRSCHSNQMLTKLQRRSGHSVIRFVLENRY